MAVKAHAQITLSAVVDIASVWWYYKLQSATLAVPAKPTANPPSGWVLTEPTYVEDSTNSLYFVELTVFTDGTFSYSGVSLDTAMKLRRLPTTKLPKRSRRRRMRRTRPPSRVRPYRQQLVP